MVLGSYVNICLKVSPTDFVFKCALPASIGKPLCFGIFAKTSFVSCIFSLTVTTGWWLARLAWLPNSSDEQTSGLGAWNSYQHCEHVLGFLLFFLPGNCITCTPYNSLEHDVCTLLCPGSHEYYSLGCIWPKCKQTQLCYYPLMGLHWILNRGGKVYDSIVKWVIFVMFEFILWTLLFVLCLDQCF